MADDIDLNPVAPPEEIINLMERHGAVRLDTDAIVETFWRERIANSPASRITTVWNYLQTQKEVLKERLRRGE